MIKKDSILPLIMDTDTAIDKRKENTSYTVLNMAVINNNGNFSLSPVKDTEELSAVGISEVLGYAEFDEVLYIVAKNGLNTTIYTLEGSTVTSIGTFTVTYSQGTRLDVIVNKESDEILKVYWIGGGNQICVVNIYDFINGSNPEIVNLYSLNALDHVGFVSGGSLKAGKIQYAYSMYNLNNSESSLSPLTPLKGVFLSAGVGGESEEPMNVSAEIEFTLPTTAFTHLRIYRVFYAELDQTPEINIIYDSEHGLSSVGQDFILFDDGNVNIAAVTSADFLNTGSALLRPATGVVKNNRLFVANYKDTTFDIPDDPAYDCRVYQHNTSGLFSITNVAGDTFYNLTGNDTNYLSVDKTFDCINTDKDSFSKIGGSSSLNGATGLNFEIKIAEYTISNNYQIGLKQHETYRIGIVFYDLYNRRSPVHWMCDFYVEYSVGSTAYDKVRGLKLEILNPSLFSATGARRVQLVVVERKPKDRTVSSPGIVQPVAVYNRDDGGTIQDLASPYYHPYHILKRILGSGLSGGDITEDYAEGVDNPDLPPGEFETVFPRRVVSRYAFYSSDLLFDRDSVQNYSKIRVIGSYRGGASDGQTLWTRKDGGVQEDGALEFAINYLTKIAKEPGDATRPLLHWFYENSDILTGEWMSLFNYTTFVTAVSPGGFKNLASQAVLNTNDIVSFAGKNYLGAVDIKPYSDWTGSNPESQYSELQAQYAPCLLLSATTDWEADDWDDFVSSPAASTAYIPIVELTRELPNQYGGNSYESKQRNTYLLKGDFHTISSGEKDNMYIGDIYVAPFYLNRVDGLDTPARNNYNLYEYIRLGNLEHNVNVKARNDDLYFVNVLSTSRNTFRLEDNHKLHGAYNQKNVLVQAFPVPPSFISTDSFDNRVIASEAKFNNEPVDSWTNFLVNDFYDINRKYGQIEKLYLFKDDVYTFQRDAVGQLAIQPNVQIQATDSTQVELGTGTVLHDHRYISTKGGTTIRDAIADDGNTLLYYDNTRNTINNLSGEEISTTRNIRKVMEVIKPASLSRVQAEYNYTLNEFVFNLNGTLLIYTPALDGFQRIESAPVANRIMMYQGRQIEHEIGFPFIGLREAYISQDSKDSEVTVVFSAAPAYDKVFHFVEWRVNKADDNANLTLVLRDLEALDSFGNSGETLGVKTWDKFGIYRAKLPRVTGTKRTRLRGRSLKVAMKFDKYTGYTGDETIYLEDVTVMYNVKG